MLRQPDGSRGQAASAVARNTASFRRRMGFGQERLAEEAGLPRKTIYNTETHGSAGTRTLEKLARVFGVSVATLMEPDAETADAVFLAKQVDRLSERGREAFFRSLGSGTADLQAKQVDVSRLRAPRPHLVHALAGASGDTDADRQLVAGPVAELFRLPESEWPKRLEEEPRLQSVAGAWEMLAQGDSMSRVNARVAASRFKLALRVIEGLAAVLPEPPHELRATAWKGIAWTLRSVGEYTEAEAALDQAEHSARFCSDRGGMLARVRLTRAIVFTTMERLDEALPLVHESREVFREIGDRLRYSMALEQEAIILLKRGEAASAVPIFKRLLKEAPDDETRAVRVGTLAAAYERAGDFVSARKTLKKALALHTTLGWTHVLRNDRWLLGRILAKTGDVEEGLNMLDRACEESQLLDDADSAVRIDLDRCQIEIENDRQTESTYDRLRAIAAYAIDKRLPQSECRALLYLQQLGRTAKPAHIVYVKDFIANLAKYPHREFVPPELAA